MATCPQCRESLTQFETPAGAALGCGGCDHVWLEAHKLEALQETAERRYTGNDVRVLSEECKARKQAALQRPVVYCKCPACGNQMLRRTFGERSFLLVHFCATHGYWIHRDELEGILAYVTRGGELLEMEGVIAKLEERLRDLEGDVRALERRAAGTRASFIPVIFPH